MKYNIAHIVDEQDDFMQPDGALYVQGAEKLIEPTNQFLKTARFKKKIVSFDTHYRKTYKKTEEAKTFDFHTIYGTRGWKLSIDVKDYVPVLKNEFDVWAKPKKMENALVGYTPKNTNVFLWGVASDYCVRQAIMGYLKRGYTVYVIADLCRGIGKQIDEVVTEINNKKLHLITTKEFQNGR